jgi:hypothetical protein
MLVLLFAALLTLAPPQATYGDIEGRVLRAGNQDPIPNVQVILIKSSAGETSLSASAAAQLDSLPDVVMMASSGGNARVELDATIEARERYAGMPPGTLARAMQTASTDANGHFSFKNQAPGKYKVLAVLDGYFGPPSGGPLSISVTVEAQKPVPPSDIFMVKGGVITGHVRDPNGQPASGINVSVSRLAYYNGRPQLQTISSKITDDRGEFRIFWVTPGQYYVDGTPRVTTGVPGPQDSWARTFYPGILDATAATAVVVNDGAEIQGIDFSIQSLSSKSTFKISGKVTNPLAGPAPNADMLISRIGFTLQPRELGIVDSATPSALRPTVGANGEFEIQNVRPGTYDLYVSYQLPRPLPGAPPPAGASAASPTPLLLTRFYIDRARVDIRDSNVEGVHLQIQPGSELRGKVVGQGNTSIAMDKIKIRLRQLDSMPEGYAVIVGDISVDPKGEFSTQNVPNARYALRLTGLPETAYVADIQQGGTTVFDSGFTLGNEPGTLIELLVNSNGATIEGSVQTANKKLSINSTVVLVPSTIHRQNDLMYKTAKTDEKGQYSLKGVAPGEYTVYAWENVPTTAWMNSEFLAKYANRGRQLVISQGTRADVQLELIADDASGR